MNNDQTNKQRSGPDLMDHRWIEDSLPGYALGCLDADESRRVTAHLSTCEGCRVLLRGYEQTVGNLALAVPQIDPPASLKAELMHRISDRPTARPSPGRRPTRSLRALFQWFSPALAMASLAAIVTLAAVNVIQWQQTHLVSRQLSVPLKIFKMRGTPLAPHADGTFVIGQNPLHGVLVVSDLPAIPVDRQFQLWLINNGTPTSGGNFSTTSLGYGVMQVSSPRPLPDYQSAAVTVEPAGGSTAPSGPELMSGKF